jgi:hypothetical protein
MKVEKQTLRSLLDGNTTYVMPLFQRGYIWEMENWQTLWEDIIRTVDDNRTRHNTQHFIGAVVLQQLQTIAGHMPQYQVIDGQQRLTTIQVMLKAFMDTLADRNEADGVRTDISKYLFNSGGKVKIESDRYKVWPTNADRTSFAAVLTDAPLDAPPNPRFDQAYQHFCDATTEWLDEGLPPEESIEDAAVAFLYVIEEGLVLAEIDLETDDDSQEIFETLNALGTPLGPADLIKNHLFRLAQTREMNLDALYATYWSKLDSDSGFWQDEVTVGRYTRTRIDIFFQYWIAVQLQRDVSADTIFRSFRELVAEADEQKITAVFESITRFARLYLRFVRYEGEEWENRFARRLNELETFAVYPLVLFFYDSVSDPQERRGCLEVIESFLVRRMLMRWNSRSYSRAGTDTIHALSQAGAITADSLRTRLREYDASGTRWPTDEELSSFLRTTSVYGSIRQSRLVMVLLAINEAMHRERSEIVDVSASDQLQIEHIMPRSWQEHWPLPEGNPAELRQQRDALVNTIGNLTVITGSLNSSVSNGAWETKRAGLNTYSNLVINRKLVEKSSWDDQSIRERSEELARYICRIWQR